MEIKGFQGLKNEFEIAVVNEPSVFEPLVVLYFEVSVLTISDLRVRYFDHFTQSS